jgi:lipid A disaccharide synthetase
MTRDDYRDHLVRMANEIERREEEYVAGEIIRLEYDMSHVARIADHVLRFTAAIALAASGDVMLTLVALGLVVVYGYRVTTQEGF